MELVVKGAGEIIIVLIDRLGRSIMQEKLTVSGSSSVHARGEVPLVLETTEGQVILAPVLLDQSNPDQKITFDGQSPHDYSKKRCKEIGVSPNITKDIGRQIQLLSQSDMTFPTDDNQELHTMMELVKSFKE
jgi:hypothetical protein